MNQYENLSKNNQGGMSRPGQLMKEQKAARPVAIRLRPVPKTSLCGDSGEETRDVSRHPILQLKRNKKREKERKEAESPNRYEQLIDHIRELRKEDPLWSIEEKDIPAYARQVADLLFEIERVDLQQMAAMMYEMRENQEEGMEESRENYKMLFTERIQYLDFILDQVKAYIHELKLKKRTEDTAAAIAASHRYLLRIMEQREILVGRCRDEGDPVVNPNILLAEKNLEAYMAIEAPSMGEFKDVRYGGRGLEATGAKLQIGFNSPVRALSWYGKYFLGRNKQTPGTPPLIRSFKAPYKTFLDFEKDVVAEQNIKKWKGKRANAEDLKVPNQFGIPASGDQGPLHGLLRSSHSLKTYVKPGEYSEEMLSGSGRVEDLDALKEKAGFGIYKEGKFHPTEFHFFNSEHTAFHGKKDSGDWSAYSSDGINKAYKKFLQLFEGLHSFLDGKQITPQVAEGLIHLLEANDFTPAHKGFSALSQDARGNDMAKLKLEDGIAVKILSTASYSPLMLEHALLSEKDGAEGGMFRKDGPKDIPLLNAFGMLGLETNLVSFMEDQRNLETLLMEFDSADPQRRFNILSFYFKLLRVLTLGSRLSKIELDDFFIDRDISAPDPFEKMSAQPRVVDGIRIPYDRNRSTFRFSRPKEDKNGIYANALTTFTGGASGTTRDVMSRLFGKSLKEETGQVHKTDGEDEAAMRTEHGEDEEKSYWKLQKLNLTFMILNRYHSLFECIYPAARIGEQIYGPDSLSASLIQYMGSDEYKFSESAEIDVLDMIDDFIGEVGYNRKEEYSRELDSVGENREVLRRRFCEYYKKRSHKVKLDPDIIKYQYQQEEMEEEMQQSRGPESKTQPRKKFPIEKFRLIPNKGGGDCLWYSVSDNVRNEKSVILLRQALSEKFLPSINGDQIADAVRESFGEAWMGLEPNDDADLGEIYSHLLKTPGVFASSTDAVIWCLLTGDTVYIIEPYQCTKCTGDGTEVIKNVSEADVKAWIKADKTVCVYLSGRHYQRMADKDGELEAPVRQTGTELTEIREPADDMKTMLTFYMEHSSMQKLDINEQALAEDQEKFDKQTEASGMKQSHHIKLTPEEFVRKKNKGGGDCLLHALEGKDLGEQEVRKLRSDLAETYDAGKSDETDKSMRVSSFAVYYALYQPGFIDEYREVREEGLPAVYKRVLLTPRTYLSSTDALLWCRLPANKGKTVYILERLQITQVTETSTRSMTDVGMEQIREWIADDECICLFMANGHFELITGMADQKL